VLAEIIEDSFKIRLLAFAENECINTRVADCTMAISAESSERPNNVKNIKTAVIAIMFVIWATGNT
jgi:hypothetical protein